MVGLSVMGRRYVAMLRALAGVEVTALCVRHLGHRNALPGAQFSDYCPLCAAGQIDMDSAALLDLEGCRCRVTAFARFDRQ